MGGFSCDLREDVKAGGADAVLEGTDNDLEGSDKHLEGAVDSLQEEHISLPVIGGSIRHLLHLWSMMDSSNEPKIYLILPPLFLKLALILENS